MKLTKNDKFYKYTDDGALILIRLKRIKNQNCFIVYDEDDNEFTLTREELKEYTKLRPNGYISISCVGLEGGLRDVIVSYYKREDLNKDDSIPYIICRQNIIDIFSLQGSVVGATVSQATCPKGLDFKTLIVARSVESIENVSYYIDDSLDDIFRPINTVNCDDLLRENKERADMAEDTPPGFCSSVKELLENNGFMFEVLLSNNICQIPSVIELSDDNSIDEKTLVVIRNLFNDIINPILIPYSGDIDISRIERDYYMIADKEYNLYILTSLN